MVKSQILIIEALPTFNKVFMLVLQHERSLGVSTFVRYESNILYTNKSVSHHKQTRAITSNNGIGKKNYVTSNGKLPIYTHNGFVGHIIHQDTSQCLKM